MAHLGNTVINGALRVLGGEYVDTINGVEVGSSPKFTDNNNAVTQTATTTAVDYEVLFSATADNTTRTEGARKNSNLTFNPSTGNLQATQLNGVTIGSAPKFTDTNNAVTQTATSTSSNYEVLFSATADNTTRTEGARKNSNLTFNPSTGNLQATQLNGTAIGSSPKFTDSHRPIQVNGSQILGDNTTALNLKAGTNVSLATSGGQVTINSTGGTDGRVTFSDPVNAVIGDTQCIINDSAITTSSMIEPFSSSDSGIPTIINQYIVSAGTCKLVFESLNEDTTFKLRITNL